MKLRLADPSADAPAIAAIYAPHVRASHASFETQPPLADAMGERIGRLRLHRSIGMRDVGTYHGVGSKDGVWRDVTWLELALRERPKAPEELIALPDFLATDAGRAALEGALRQMT